MAAALLTATTIVACSSETSDDPILPNDNPEDPSTTDTPLEGIDEDGNEYRLVPFTVYIGSDWGVDEDGTDSRALPPSSSGSNWLDGWDDVKGGTYQVEILTYKRRADSADSADSADPLLQDASNHLYLRTTIKTVGHDYYQKSHYHYEATGYIKLIKGWEYRVIALAYDTSKQYQYASVFPEDNSKYYTAENGWPSNKNYQPGNGEQNWFYIDPAEHIEEAFARMYVIEDGGKGKDTEISAYYGAGNGSKINGLNQNFVACPQYFYGYLTREGSSKKTISYADVDDEGQYQVDIPLTGILYRAVAKVDVEINNVNTLNGTGILTRIRHLWMMASHTQTNMWLVKLDNYPSEINDNSAYEGSTAEGNQSWTCISYFGKMGDGRYTVPKTGVKTSFYILPSKTMLALRAVGGEQSNSDGIAYANNGLLKPSNVQTFDTATGVISPDTYENEFFFRRNHKYKIIINDTDDYLEYKHVTEQ